MGMVARWGEGRFSREGGASAQLPAESGCPGRVGWVWRVRHRTQQGQRTGRKAGCGRLRPGLGDGTAASRNTRGAGKGMGHSGSGKACGTRRGEEAHHQRGPDVWPRPHALGSTPAPVPPGEDSGTTSRTPAVLNRASLGSCPKEVLSRQEKRQRGARAQATSHGRRGQLGAWRRPPCVDGGSLGGPHWCMGSCPV